MAKVIPRIPADYHGSPGEQEAMLALRHLPDGYYVYHSRRWLSESTRATQGEADFLIFHPDKGFVVIEVKSGGITCSDGVWRQMNQQTKVERVIADPAAQAERSRFNLAEKIQPYLPAGEGCLSGHAVWFTAIERKTFTYPPNYVRDIVLDRTDLANPLPAIERLFRFWNSKHAYRDMHRLSHAGKERLLVALAPEVNAAASLRSPVDERDEQMVRLTREQTRVLDFLEEQTTAAICGRAGTGKTFVAWEKGRRLAARGERVLFLCYNAALKDFLRSRNSDLPALEVHSFHSLAARQVGPEDDLRRLESKFIDYAIGGGDKLPYRHILIDEAQDFADEWLQALQLLRDPDGIFYAFFDRYQMINREDFPATLDRLECRLVLDTNCRNTRQVARTSLSFMELERFGAFKAVDGPSPRVHIVANERERLARAGEIVTRKLSGGEYQPHEIAVLVFDPAARIEGKVGGFRIADRIEEGSVCCTSIRRFKGLEAKVIILLDASAKALGTAQRCREFYVGTSRAMHELHVIFQARDDAEIGAFIGEVCERDGRKLRKGLKGLKQLLGAETT
jgi:hypothetical protein